MKYDIIMFHIKISIIEKRAFAVNILMVHLLKSIRFMKNICTYIHTKFCKNMNLNKYTINACMYIKYCL